MCASFSVNGSWISRPAGRAPIVVPDQFLTISTTGYFQKTCQYVGHRFVVWVFSPISGPYKDFPPASGNGKRHRFFQKHPQRIFVVAETAVSALHLMQF